MKRPFLCLAMLACAIPWLTAQDSSNVKPKRKAAAASKGPQQPLGESLIYKTIEGKDLHLYVMKPQDWQASDKRPAAVFFHGGGWKAGNASQFNYQGHHLTTRGMVVVQVQYRLIQQDGEIPLKAAADARSAMRWVRAHASELGIDPNRIAAGGGSAGGHLAAYVGMVDGADDPSDDLKVSPKPNALLLFNPALLHGQERATLTPEIRAKLAPISPWKAATPDDPPGLILVGSEDGILKPDKVKEFQDMCHAVGVRMEAVIYPGEGHGFFGLNKSRERFFDTVREMEKFLASLGWISGPPTLTQENVLDYVKQIKMSASR
ncbi:Acetyl esterase/lipase [Prosthecobacter debontii]|uniref:Acetyl esterase/lipase n=1 Tax=Prosthecobacter debontii TaxID=48467 RepID=A0A1T4YKI2_9BACT|nr:alpha/beta hydrolase [Prosthecobacter debontii]SKB02058.1 Acetyl esterase/lipase [Prosthecobacter debontii]